MARRRLRGEDEVLRSRPPLQERAGGEAFEDDCIK